MIKTTIAQATQDFHLTDDVNSPKWVRNHYSYLYKRYSLYERGNLYHMIWADPDQECFVEHE